MRIRAFTLGYRSTSAATASGKNAVAKAGVAPPEGLGAGGLSGDEGVKQTGVSTVPAPTSTPAPTSAPLADRTVDTEADPTPEDGPAGRG